jgi:hypothetical protein
MSSFTANRNTRIQGATFKHQHHALFFRANTILPHDHNEAIVEVW